MPNQDHYYTGLLSDLTSGKDSILEMAKVIEYDPKEVKAKVFTLTSQQTKSNVPVFFPSQKGNHGIFSPPAPNSVSLLYWGPDREPFLLPIQLTVPAARIVNGKMTFDVNPGAGDEDRNIENIEGGEHLLRSLGGASIGLKNTGDLELATDLLHQIFIDRNLGQLELIFDRVREMIGTYDNYKGPLKSGDINEKRFHMKETIFENISLESKIDDMSDEQFIEMLENNEDMHLINEDPILVEERGHILDDYGDLERLNDSDLFSKKVFKKDDVQQTSSFNKKGKTKIELTKGEDTTVIEYDHDEVEVQHHSGTSFKIKGNGDIDLYASNNVNLDAEHIVLTERSLTEYD